MDFCPIKKSAKVKPSRDFDVLYDPILCLPTKKDYIREVERATAMSLTYIIKPRYNAMFSDTRLSLDLIPKKPYLEINIPEKDTLFFQRRAKIDVTGSKRALFFKQPLPLPRPTSSSTMPSLPEGILDEGARMVKSASPTCCTKATQTDFRESETQTSSWTHDVIAKQGMQLLNLNWFNAEKNFPIGMEEIQQIERGAQRQEWEEVLLRLRCVDFDQWSVISTAMVANETFAREEELEAFHVLRMRRSMKQLAIAHLTNRNDLKGRLQRLLALCEENAAEKLKYMKHQLKRGLRKVDMLDRGISKKYKKRDILTELRDKASEMYAPQPRFGRNPARRHQVIDVKSSFLQKLKGFEVLEKRVSQSTHQPRGFDFDKASKPPKPGIFCKRSGEIFDYGCDYISTGNEGEKRPQSGALPTVLRRRRIDLANTPEYDDGSSEWESYEQWSNVTLKSVIKGRSVQTVIQGALREVDNKA